MGDLLVTISNEHSYFQVINSEFKTSLKLVRNKEPLMINEITEYLTKHSIPFNSSEINKVIHTLTGETVIKLCDQKSRPIRESVVVSISNDKMQAWGKFYPPSNDGESIRKDDIISDLRFKGVLFGYDEIEIERFLAERVYGVNIVLAVGKEPRQGKDAYIEYKFNTDIKARPTVNEDGTVDFFQLNIINHVKKGDCLAVLHKEDPGDDGRDVLGGIIKPKTVKKQLLKFGRKIQISEDKCEIFSEVDGHVTLVDGKVFVSDVMTVENVDISTGDITYEGNVQVNGNVCSNFTIHAKGNVEVRGVVEGAEIYADGNVTIARGVNGMTKGIIKAGGNVIAKFIENANVEARGYIEAGSILHSKVFAGTEVHVGGKRGFITGGYVSATNLVEVKTLGAELGANTIVEIGINPEIKHRYEQLEELLDENNRALGSARPVIEAAKKKIFSGVKLPPEQVRHIQDLSNLVTAKTRENEAAIKELEELENLMQIGNDAQIIVHDKVYPGTKIVIADVSRIVKTESHYCRFIKSQGDVAIVGMN